MKKKLLDLLKILAFLSVVAVLVLVSMRVVERKESNYKYAAFFDQAKKGNIDVLFLGSSHVINAINPAVLYDNYGFTSYNMGGHGSVMQSTYWELIQALDYCSPEWVVVDTYMLEKNYQYLDVMEENAGSDEVNTSVEQLHLNMDCFRPGKLKAAALKDLIQDPKTRREFMFDFMVYHDRWTELEKDDYLALFGKEERNPLFGAEMRYDVELTPFFSADPEPGQELAEHTVGEEYLMKIIDECQRRGIGVLVTYLPFCATTEDKIAANSAGSISNMYSVPYINMLNTDIIDMYSDLNDTGHLNANGAVKVTNYIGQWLFENAGLTDHRNDDRYKEYADSAAVFRQQILDMETDSEDLYSVVNLLSLEKESFVLYFNQDSAAFNDPSLKALVKSVSGTEKVYSGNGPYILINDISAGAKYEAVGNEILDGVPTALGSMVYQPVEKRFRLFYALEDESINYLYDDDHLDYDIQLIAYDKESGEIEFHQYYRSYGGKYRTN